MNSKTITKAFKGKVVKEIALNPAWDNVRKSYYYDPKIIFTDGTLIGFFVQETDVGEYGVKPVSHVLDDVDLPICENCCNVLTIRDPIADSDGQSLLCRQCELLAGYKAGTSICFASGRNYGASFMRALKERSMLDPDAPDAIVAATDKKEAKWLHNHLKK